MDRTIVPDVAFTTTVYVPAGVPEVVVTLLLPPQPTCNNASAKNAPTVRLVSQYPLRDFLRETPAPRSVNPEIGSNVANSGPLFSHKRVLVVVRAVVVISRVRFAGPLLRFGIVLLLKLHAAPVGRVPHANVTLSGIVPVPPGVTCTVYIAGTPAGFDCVDGGIAAIE